MHIWKINYVIKRKLHAKQRHIGALVGTRMSLRPAMASFKPCHVPHQMKSSPDCRDKVASKECPLVQTCQRLLLKGNDSKLRVGFSAGGKR